MASLAVDVLPRMLRDRVVAEDRDWPLRCETSDHLLRENPRQPPRQPDSGKGELFALAWSDIDFNSRTLTVRRSREEIPGRLALKEPKSEAGRRQVKLPQAAADSLQEHRKRVLAAGRAGLELVFTDVEAVSCASQIFSGASGIHCSLLRAGSGFGPTICGTPML